MYSCQSTRTTSIHPGHPTNLEASAPHQRLRHYPACSDSKCRCFDDRPRGFRRHTRDAVMDRRLGDPDHCWAVAGDLQYQATTDRSAPSLDAQNLVLCTFAITVLLFVFKTNFPVRLHHNSAHHHDHRRSSYLGCG